MLYFQPLVRRLINGELPLQRELGTLCLYTAALLIALQLLGGTVYWWSPNWLRTVVRPEDPVPAIATCLTLVGLLLVQFRRLSVPVLAGCGLFSLLLCFGTSLLQDPYAIIEGPFHRGIVLLGAALTLLVAPRTIVSVLAVTTPLVMFSSFLTTLHGTPIVSDDHASFIFRLSVLKEQFPAIPFYYPGWNGGLDARDFFATGSLNVFFLFYPLIAIFDVSTIYPYIVGGILFVLLPLSTYFGARLLDSSRLAAACSVVLALSANLLWYRWSLKYGPIGFLTSVSLMPLIMGLAGRWVINRAPISRAQTILLTAAGALCLCWAPSSIALLPIGVAVAVAFLKAPAIRGQSLRVTLAIGLAVAPVLLALCAVSNPLRFISGKPHSYNQVAQTQEKIAKGGEATLEPKRMRGKVQAITTEKVTKNLHDSFVSWNPLLLSLVPLGAALMATRLRFYLLATFLYLALLGTVVALKIPQMELDRMTVILSILMALPAGVAASSLIERSSPFYRPWSAALVTGFLVVSAFAACAIPHNRTLEQFTRQSRQTNKLVHAIQELPHPGRILFAGCLLHELDGGHFAPLSLYTNRSLVGSAPFHSIWWYTSVFPDEIAKGGLTTILPFLDAWDAKYVISHEPVWIEFMRKHPQHFSEVFYNGRFIGYERPGYTPTKVLTGTAEDFQETLSTVSFTPTSAELTIKYTYYPFLTVDSCTSITPVILPGNVTVSKLSGCTPGTRATIRSVSPIRRVLMSFNLAR